jgi:hypothetical protein
VTVVIYPADRYGCGHHRLIWPARELEKLGYDVHVVPQENRKLEFVVDDDDVVRDVKLADGVEAVVFQRVTHAYLAQAIRLLTQRGVAVIVELDDDLMSIDPGNPAFRALHPAKGTGGLGHTHRSEAQHHSWRNLNEACRHASLVTATTPALIERYAPHGRGRVLPNFLAPHYYGIDHDDSRIIGWPAALPSHPNDPAVVGPAVARLVSEGERFHVTSTSPGVGRAFGMTDDSNVEMLRTPVDLLDWPRALAERIGVGIAPLADTKFNASKSWLKPLELSAVGIPWIGSPSVEYRRLNDAGCGMIAKSPQDWYKMIRFILRNDEFRREESEKCRAVARELSIERHAWLWWEAWQDAIAYARGTTQKTTVSR